MAAYYPDHPTDEEKAAARGMIDALRLLYPCAHCRAQLVEDLKLLPVESALRSRSDFSVWMCEQHNLVNAALGERTGARELAGQTVIDSIDG
jgi:FAD-linked sulfhydryl oxidase